jgi:sugar transferase (PEP-CTERM system associated)
MFENRFTLRKIFLMFIDLLLLFLALYLSLKLKFLISGNHFYAFANHFWDFFAIFLFWLVIFYLFDLYDLKKIRSLAFLMSTEILAGLINLGVAILYFYLFHPNIEPKTVLAFTILIGLVLILGWRWIWNKYLARNLKTRAAIIGSEEAKIKVLKEIISPSESSFEVVGFITLGQDSTLLNHDFSILGNYHDLIDIIKREKIDELIVAFNYYKYPEATQKLTMCLSLGIKISELSLVYEESTGKVPVDYIDQIWFLGQLKNHRRFFHASERFFDVIVSVVGLILSIPVWLILPIIIKLNSKGSVLYKQIRVGRNEQPFSLLKFRSMRQDAESQTGAVWSKANDPRITKVGNFMRKIRLDEVPQLINVLKGDMSFVGPRPERPEFVSQLKDKIPFYLQRHLVKPGLTGWAQIKYKYGNTEEDALIKLQYDLYYVKNRSALLYLMVLIRTIRIIFTKAGI